MYELPVKQGIHSINVVLVFEHGTKIYSQYHRLRHNLLGYFRSLKASDCLLASAVVKPQDILDSTLEILSLRCLAELPEMVGV